MTLAFSFIHPHLGNLVIENVSRHLFKILRHNKFTNESLLHLGKRHLHLSEKTIVSYTLLEEHSIHGFFIGCGIFLRNFLEVENFRCSILKEFGLLTNLLLTRFTFASALFRLHRYHILKQISGSNLGGSNLSVIM